VIDYLKSKNNFNMRLEISREDDQLLDTGGGLKKAAWFFQENSASPDEPFFLHNVDVISDIDLNAMRQFHKDHDALATLAVQSRASSRQLLFNKDLQLSGRRIEEKNTVISSSPHAVILSEAKNPGTISTQPTTAEATQAKAHSPLATSHSLLLPSENSSALLPLAFSGIHVISPRLLPTPGLPRRKNPGLPPRQLLLARPRQARRPSPSRPRPEVTAFQQCKICLR
jgi:hypothetical protein